jgi:hypothetical protein
MIDKDPWNLWWGLNEGEMIDELEELDALHGWYDTRAGMEAMEPEAVRKLWWRTAGVFQFGNTLQIDAALDEQQEKYDV